MPRPTVSARRRRASTLLASLLCLFLCTTLVALALQTSSKTAVDAIRVRQSSETQRAALGYVEYVAARFRAELEKPSAPGAPDQAYFASLLQTVNDRLPTADILGVDTTRYTLRLEPAQLEELHSRVDTTLPMTRLPSRKDMPGLGQRASLALSQGIRCTISLTEKTTGKVTTVSARADLVYVKNTFLQFGYYFNGFKPQISSGTQNKFKGGIFSNNPIRLATNDWGDIGIGSIIQVDKILGPEITLSSNNSALRSKYFNGIYINAGDLATVAGSTLARQDGKITYFATKDTPLSNLADPYNPTAAKSDFLPAFLTPADLGKTASLSNYYRNLYDAGETAGFPLDAVTKLTGALIDSHNPNIKTLSMRFNGNYADAQTGWQARYPDTLPKSMQQIPPDELAAAGEVPTDPHAIIEAPKNIDAGDASRGSARQQQEVEDAKFANKSNFYILVENPATPNTQPLPPVIFNSAKVAAAYKAESAKLATDAERLALRESATYAGSIIVLPGSAANAIEVKRSFFDRSQRQVSQLTSNWGTRTGTSADDKVKGIRVSAVDVNMGVLRDAIGTSATTTALTMADGTAWDPNSATAGWTGVVYVDVDKPKGNAWVARDSADSPTEYAYDTTTPVKGLKTVPGDYTYSGGGLINTTTTATAGDPLDKSKYETLVAVRLYNTVKVPDLSGYPGYTGAGGCTVATNTSVYTVGHVNADGVRNTDLTNNASDKRYADPGASATAKESEPTPFAIACDSLTALAPSFYRDTAGNWDPTYTQLDGGDRVMRSMAYETEYPRGFTDKFHEMNFSVLSGGSDKDMAQSCGNGFFNPAFLINTCCGQYRKDLDTRFRGSKNAIFASKYNKKYYSDTATSYERSNDDAYDLRLLESFANVPPGMPSFRKFTLLNLSIVPNR